MSFRQFVSIRGLSNKEFSDSGSQLVAASKELREMFNTNLDWNKIRDYSSDNGIQWQFSPGEAPWYNGCCEALIRSVKKSIMITVGNEVITFNELQTFNFEAANLVNDRPIGKHPDSVDDGSYLCPNDMILGRSSTKAPTGNFDKAVKSKRRFYFVQRLVDSFWKRWTIFYFPSLLSRRKWHQQKRNLCVNDLVIIKDKDLPRGKWKLGIISKVTQDIDGAVRRVFVKYKNFNSNAYLEIKRPVQNLIVIDSDKPE